MTADAALFDVKIYYYQEVLGIDDHSYTSARQLQVVVSAYYCLDISK